MAPPTVAVIGAGISGLACAHRLLELQKKTGKEIRLSVFEADSRPGGLVRTEKKDGFLLEKGPDAFLREKPWALELVKRLGLEEELIGTRADNRRSSVVRNGKLLPVPEGFYLISPVKVLPFLASPFFSFGGKMRMLAEPFVPRRRSDEDESVANFVRRRFGAECLERAGQPMLAGIYTGDPEDLSLDATLPRFRRLEKDHGSVLLGLRKEKKEKEMRQASGARYGLFLSFRQGMQTFTDALASRLPQGALRLSTPMHSLSAEEKKWKVTTPQGEVSEADAVCCTLSARSARSLLKDTFQDLTGPLSELRYESVATVNLAYREGQIKKPSKGFGFVTPRGEKRSVLACTFTDQKFEGRAPAGYRLFRAFVGGAFGRGHFERMDEEMSAALQNDLRELLGAEGEPVFARIQRHPGSMVQYGVGHLRWLEGLRKRLEAHPGLFLAGNSYGGTGIPDCVREAEEQAEGIFRYLYPTS